MNIVKYVVPGTRLTSQSFDSRLRLDMRRPINGDGFGVGYYPVDQDQDADVEKGPCVFCAITPAWNNINLDRLAEKTKSNLVFAHVRASTAGVLSETNCHPFVFHTLMFMHNGNISGFSKIKRNLATYLKDEYFNFVQGGTDSEWAFALYLDTLSRLGHDPADPVGKFPPEALRKALLQTLELIKEWTKNALGENADPSLLNIAVTDGNTVVVSRYVTSKTEEAASLHFSSGSRFIEYEPGQYRMERRDRAQNIVMIASEPLTFERNDWIAIPTNTVVTIKNQTVLMHPIVDEFFQSDPSRPRRSEYAESKGLLSPVVVSNTATSIPPLEREGRRRNSITA